MTPWSRSSTFTRLWSAANMVEPRDGAPPLRQAFSLMTNSSSSLSLPCSSWSNTTSTVISLARLAGAIELVGVLLEQHGAAVGLDQDRVRRRGLELLLLRSEEVWAARWKRTEKNAVCHPASAWAEAGEVRLAKRNPVASSSSRPTPSM